MVPGMKEMNFWEEYMYKNVHSIKKTRILITLHLFVLCSILHNSISLEMSKLFVCVLGVISKGENQTKKKMEKVGASLQTFKPLPTI